MKRAITLALAAGALCVVVASILGRDELIERWYVYQISRDESRFDELLREGGEVRRRALKRYLRTAEGKAFLARRCEEVLRLGPQEWMRDVRRGALSITSDYVLRSKVSSLLELDYQAISLGEDRQYDHASAFLSLLDEFEGLQFELSGNSAELVVEIVPTCEALPRTGWFPRLPTPDRFGFRFEGGGSLDDGPPPDWTDEHAQALGDHPALFYSRE